MAAHGRRASKLVRGGAGEEEAACPAWVRGAKSVLDVDVSVPILVPPVALYLEEVLLGIVGGAGDPATKDAPEPGARRAKGRVSPVHRMEALQGVVALEATQKACLAVFWLVLAGAFDQSHTQAVRSFRSDLGENWFAVTLQTMSKHPGDRDMQDAILSALPLVFAQVVYRLLVDGFVEDRKHFVKDADALLMKSSQVAHFELTGFQVSSEAVRRMRQRLFVKRVVKTPHMNQHEFMRGRKRQEILEGAHANAADQPMTFGDTAMDPVEETQLEHLMHGSDSRRKSELQKLAAGKQAWELETTPVPQHLSVERHMGLWHVGDALHDAHMQRLRVILAEEEDEQGQESEDEDAAIDSPVPSEPASPGLSPVSQQRGRAWDPDVQAEEPESPKSPKSPASPACDGANDRSKRLWRRGVAIAKMNMVKEEQRARRDREAKAKKLRQEALVRKIYDPLPKELSERSFSTTWVSPPMMSLAGEQDRQDVLNKPPSDAFRLKMGGLQKTSSAPGLRPQSREAAQQRPPSGATVTATDTIGTSGGATPTARGSGGRRPSSMSAGLPRVGAASKAAAAAAPPVPTNSGKGEALGIEPPSRLCARVMMGRIEAEEKAFQKLSFAIYMREHDVLTGIKKLTMDQRKLRDEESAYVKKMRALVGGKRKMLLSPESLRPRHARAGVAVAAAVDGGGAGVATGGSGGGGRPP